METVISYGQTPSEMGSMTITADCSVSPIATTDTAAQGSIGSSEPSDISAGQGPTIAVASEPQGLFQTANIDISNTSTNQQGSWNMTTLAVDSQGSPLMGNAEILEIPDQQGSLEMGTMAVSQSSFQIGDADVAQIPADQHISVEVAAMAVPVNSQEFLVMEVDSTQICKDHLSLGQIANTENGQTRGASAGQQGSWETTTMAIPADSQNLVGLTTGQMNASAGQQGSWETTTMAIPADSQSLVGLTTGQMNASTDQSGTLGVTTMAIAADSQGMAGMMATGQMNVSADQQGSCEMTTMAIPTDSQYSVGITSAQVDVFADQKGSCKMTSMTMPAGSQYSLGMTTAQMSTSADQSGSFDLTTTMIPDYSQNYVGMSNDQVEASADHQGSWEMTTMAIPADSQASVEMTTTQIPVGSDEQQGSWDMTTMAIPADSQASLEMTSTQIPFASADQQGSWEMTTMAIPLDSTSSVGMTAAQMEASADQQGSWEMTTMAIPADSQASVEMTSSQIPLGSDEQQGSWDMTTMAIPADIQASVEMISTQIPLGSEEQQGSWEMTTMAKPADSLNYIETNTESSIQPATQLLDRPAMQEAAIQCNLQDGTAEQDNTLDAELIALKSSVETLTQRAHQLEAERAGIMETYTTAVGQYEASHTNTVQEYEVKLGEMRLEKVALEKRHEETLIEVEQLQQKCSQMAEEHEIALKEQARRIQEIENQGSASLEEKYECEKQEAKRLFEEQLAQLQQENEALLSAYQKSARDYEVRLSDMQTDNERRLGTIRLEREKLEDNNEDMMAMHNKTVSDYKMRIQELEEDFQSTISQITRERNYLEREHGECLKKKTELESEYKLLEERYKAYMEEVERYRDDNERQGDEEEAAFEREKQELLKKYEMAVEDYEARIKEITKTFETEILEYHSERDLREEKHNEEIRSWQEEVLSLKDRHKDELLNLEVEMTESFEAEKDMMRARFSTENEELIGKWKALIEDCETKIANIRSEYDLTLAQVEEAKCKQEERLQAKIVSLQQEIASKEKDYETRTRKMQEEFEEDNEKARCERDAAFAEQMDSLTAEHDKTAASYEMRLKEMAKDNETALAQSLEERQRLAETCDLFSIQRDEWEDKHSSLDSTHQKSIKDLKEEYEKIIEDSGAEKQRIVQEHQIQIEGLRVECEDRISTIEIIGKQEVERYRSEIEKLQARFAATEASYEERIQRMDGEMTDILRREADTMENLIKKNEEMASNYKNNVLNYETNIAKISQDYEVKISKLELRWQEANKSLSEREMEEKDEITRLNELHQSRMDELKKRMMEEWENERKELLLTEQAENERKVEEKFAAEREELLTAHKHTLQRYEESMARLEQSLSDEVGKLQSIQKQNEETEKAMVKAMEEMAANFQREKVEIDARYKNEMNDMESQFESTLRQAEAMHAKELENVKEERDIKVADVKNAFLVQVQKITDERDLLLQRCKDLAEKDSQRDDRREGKLDQLKETIKLHQETIEKTKRDHREELDALNEVIENLKRTVDEKTEQVALREKENEVERESRRDERNEFEVTLKLLEKKIKEYKETIAALEEKARAEEEERNQLSASFDEILLKEKRANETKFFEETARLQKLLDNELQQKVKLGEEIRELLQSLLSLKEKYQDMGRKHDLEMKEMNEKLKHATEASISSIGKDAKTKALIDQQKQKCALLEKEKEKFEAVIKDLTKRLKELENSATSEEQVHELEEEKQNLLAEVYRLKAQNEEYEKTFEATWDLQLRSSRLQEESKYWRSTYEEISTKQEKLLSENERLTSEVEELFRSRDHHAQDLPLASGDSVESSQAKNAKGSSQKNDAELEEALNSFRLKVIFLTEEKPNAGNEDVEKQVEQLERESTANDDKTQKGGQGEYVRQTHKEWEAKILEIQSQHQEETEAIRKRMDELLQEFEAEKEAMVDSFNKEKKALQDNLDEQRQMYEREKKITEHECGVELLVLKETEIIRTRFEKEKYELEQTLGQEKEKTRIEFQRSLQLEKENYASALERQQRETDGLRKLKAQLEARIHDVERKQDEERYRLSSCFSEEKRKLQEEYYASLEEVKRGFSRGMADMSKQKSADEENRLKENLNLVEKRVKEELSSKLLGEASNRERHLQEVLYGVEQERDASNEKVLELERKIASLTELFRNDKEVITEQCEREKGDMRKRFEHEKEMVRLAHEATKTQLRRLTGLGGNAGQSITARTGAASIQQNGSTVENFGSSPRTSNSRSVPHSARMEQERCLGGFQERARTEDGKLRRRMDRDSDGINSEVFTGGFGQNADHVDVMQSRIVQKRPEGKRTTQGGFATLLSDVAKLRDERKVLECEVSLHQTRSGDFAGEVDALRMDLSDIHAAVEDKAQGGIGASGEGAIQGNYDSRQRTPSPRSTYRQLGINKGAEETSTAVQENSSRRSVYANRPIEPAYAPHHSLERNVSQVHFISYNILRLLP